MSHSDQQPRTPLAVLGAGAWGTALAIRAACAGTPVRLWGRDTAALQAMALSAENSSYLPKVRLPSAITPSTDLGLALRDVSDVLIAVPSAGFIETLELVGEHVSNPRIAWACKGLERDTGRLLSEVVAARFGSQVPLACVSGPTFALEVAAGLPTAVVVGSTDAQFARNLSSKLHQACFRVYTSADLIGVQLGGAAKNVLAIAAGISDGLGFGANARAALIARGLAEMMRLGLAYGARVETLQGLAGLGDLVLTCTDDQSRNRRFGLAVGAGASPSTAISSTANVVEGANASRDFAKLSERLGVETPIMSSVNQIIWHQMPPRQAVAELLSRQPGTE
jgi:glycerol-3-phosphate dehydrogenase (NAD(P)+)